MSISLKNDYSALFSSLSNSSSSSSSSSSSNFGISLSDYASIKNGSYTKLLKAYYKKTDSADSTSSSSDTDSAKSALSSAKTAASDFKSAVEALESVADSDDTDKIYEAVSNFADTYNSLTKAAGNSGSSSIKKIAQNMVNYVGENLSVLADAGITLDTDGKMSVNETTLKANTTPLKTLFSSTGSFGDVLAAKASSISNKATSALNAASTYTSKASYSSASATGSIFDSYN